MTAEMLNKNAASSPLVAKYSKRIAMLESARKVSGVKQLNEYEKYYAARLFENINRGNIFEAYTQSNVTG